MQRLLQGEVGSGKTVVALRALLAAVDAGQQGALLAPTEVLAGQHFESITRLLGDLGAGRVLGAPDEATEVVLLTGSMSAAAKRDVRAKIADGSFSPFTGPLTKADGSEGVAAGVVMTDAEIVAMDWHVKGVITPLPQ